MKHKISRNIASAICFSALAAWLISSTPLVSQVINPGVPVSGTPANNDCAKFVVSGGNVQSITTTGAGCTGPSPVGANPTATASDTAVNGVATTFMRSDASPAVQKASATQFGLVEVDNITIKSTLGVIAAQVLTFGAQTVAPGSSAVVQGNGGAIQLANGSFTSQNCLKYDVNGNAVDNGSPCATQASGANPTATAGPTAVNGTAVTFMRSDGAPAIQKATNALFGIVETDNTTIQAAAGVISAKINGILPTPTRAGDILFWNGTTWVTLAGNNSGTQILSENASGVPAWSAAGAGTVTSVVCAATTITTTGTCYSAGQIVGTATNDSATAGNFGEFIKSDIPLGSAISITTITAANVTSISLTAGDWDVTACGYFIPAVSTNLTLAEISINTTSATRNNTVGAFAQLGLGSAGVVIGGSSDPTVCVPVFRESLSTTTTIFMVVFSQFTISGNSVAGSLHARRVR